MTTHLQAALDLAEKRGFFVFPCQPWDQPASAAPDKRGKRPIPSNGFKAATRDPDQIRRWWQQWPTANIGVACGASSIVVIDIDGQAGAEQVKYGGYDLPETLTSQTGKKGGRHYIYRAGAREIGNRVRIFGDQGDKEGVDIRGQGGYIIVPPSKHYSENVYQWEDEDAEIAALPLWIMEIHWRSDSRLDEARNLAKDEDQELTEGSRNDKLFGLGCMYRRDNNVQDQRVMFNLLWAENQQRCKPPLDEEEVRKIANSAVRKLPDEVDIAGAGFWDQAVKYAESTNDVALVKKVQAVATEYEAKKPDAGDGKLAIELCRYVVPDMPEGKAFSVTVRYMGKEATVHRVPGEVLSSPSRMKAMFVSELIMIPLLKQKQWDHLVDEAFVTCTDIEAPLETTVVGACVEAIHEWMRDLEPVTNWAKFPIENESAMYDFEDGTYGLHSDTLRRKVSYLVKDAKRADVTAALRVIGASDYRVGGKGSKFYRVPQNPAR